MGDAEQRGQSAYAYPAPGTAHPHGPTAIGPFTISNDSNGNQIQTLGTGTSDQSQYLFDEENRLSCANKGPQTPSPSCNAQGSTEFIYDHAGVRKIKVAASPTIYPNQHYTDFGGPTSSPAHAAPQSSQNFCAWCVIQANLPEEVPRLCRGGSNSLTFTAVVHRRNSDS